MEEYENPNDMPHQVPSQESANDRYTYYSSMPVRSSEYRYVPEPPKKKKKRKHTWMMVLVVVLCCLLSGAMGVGGVLLAQQIQAEKAEEVPEVDVSYVLQGVRENSVIEIVEIDTGKQMTPAEVYAANVNSTVGITTSVTTNFWGYQSTSAASGSGFIISVDGYLIPLAIISTYPLIFSQYGEVYLLTSYGSLIAYFVMGAALIAIGVWKKKWRTSLWNGFATKPTLSGMTV